MRRTLALTTLLLAAALLPASPAAGKELAGLAVCGAHGCTDRSGEIGRDAHALLDTGVGVADPSPAPWVRMRVGYGDGTGEVLHTSVLAFVPGAGVLRFEDGTWWRPAPEALARLRRLARGVERLPAARLPLPEAEPAARVVETYVPAREAAARPPAAAAGDGGGPAPGVWAGLAAVALAAGSVGLVVWRRRRGTTGSPATG